MNLQPQVSPSNSPTSDLQSPPEIISVDHKQTLSIIAGFSILSLFALFLYNNILWSGSGIPWGSDTSGQIFRFTFLQDSIRQGIWFPQIVPQWYLGIQLFRYYPPLVYYLLAGFNSILHNPVMTTNLFIVGAAWLGGITWLLYYRWIGTWPAVIGGCLYMALPDLLRVSFAEGNLLRHFTSALIPLAFFLVLYILKSQNKPTAFLSLAAVFGLMVLGHPMMAAIIAAMAALLILIAFITKAIDLRKSIFTLAAILAGILSAGFWLLPSLTGGITELNAEAVIAGLDVVPLWQLISPLTRLHNIESLYLGVGIFTISLVGLLTSIKRRDEVFALALTGLIGAMLVTPVLNSLYNAFPLASLMWPARFLAPASFLLLLASVWFLSRTPNKWIAVVIFAVLLVDGWGGTSLIFLRPKDADLEQISSLMAQLPGWREATLDQSRLGSAPSDLVSSLGARDQVFGWGFQGVVNAELISSLNEAIQMGNSTYLADRLSLLGVDDLILPTTFPLPYGLEDTFLAQGFSLVFQGDRMNLMHRDGAPRAVRFDNEILAIGSGAQNYAYIFPQIMVGSSANVQDYTVEELTQFKLVILSGFHWNDLTRAEDLVRQVVSSGTKVVVDLHNAQEDPIARSPKFLDVWGEKVILPNQPILAESELGSIELAPFEYQGELWYTITPQGLDEELVTYPYLNSTAVITGVKSFGENDVLFIGANLAYHIISSSDTAAIGLLADSLGIPAMQISDYQTVSLTNYQVTPDSTQFDVQMDESSRLIIPLSSFDGTQVQLDGVPITHQNYYDLITVQIPAGLHTVTITTVRPFIYTLGWITTILAVVSLCLLLYLIWKKQHEH